jgi:drug/metabolite transporter (DMT)-like permease
MGERGRNCVPASSLDVIIFLPMPNYLFGVLIAFFEPILHAWSNVVDNHFSNNLFPNLSTLLFFGTIVNILFLPIIAFLDPPQTLSYSLLAVVFAISFVNVMYQFPYYWALRHADTSIVISLFFFGFIFIPILAYFIVGERLAVLQYFGFVLIIISALLLTFDVRKLRFNRAFFLMIGVSLLLAVQTILYKYAFDAGASWGSVVTASTIFDIFISGVVMLTVNPLWEIALDFQKIRGNLKLFFLQQGLEWGGNASGSFAVSVLPATVARGIVSTQPFFVLVYALLFGRAFPHMFKELVDGRELVKKSILFGVIIIGTILVVTGGSSLEAYL